MGQLEKVSPPFRLRGPISKEKYIWVSTYVHREMNTIYFSTYSGFGSAFISESPNDFV